ncbi:MAG: hypothetical protein GY769_10845 [bacterium]|nr:hypothetical protein [bacterium]
MRTNLILSISLLAILAVLAVPADARGLAAEGQGWCGTDGYHSRLLEAEAKSRWFESRASGRLAEDGRLARAASARRAPGVRKEGVVAVIEDDGSVVAVRNLFDFSNNSVSFLKKKSKLRAKPTSADINPDFGDRIQDSDWGACETIAPVDDDSMRLDLPFRVKFYGTKYRQVYASNPRPESAPQIGVEFGGQRVDFTVDNIIDEVGPRVPAAADAPKTFNMAFILVAADGQPARPESIAKLKTFANEWVKYFNNATDGNGSVSIKLKERK